MAVLFNSLRFSSTTRLTDRSVLTNQTLSASISPLRTPASFYVVRKTPFLSLRMSPLLPRLLS